MNFLLKALLLLGDDSSKKQNIEYLLKGNIFFPSNDHYRFIYTISDTFVALLDLSRHLQNNKSSSLIIHSFFYF